MEKHLFITISDTHVSFRDPETYGQDPAKDDTERLKIIVKLIKYYGDGATVEIRDDRTF